MRAIELGCDLHVQLQRLPGRLHARSVGNGPQEIAAQANESAYPTCQNAFTGVHGAQPHLRWHLEAELLLDQFDRDFFWIFGNPHGALALDVGVATNRADPGARFAKITAHQQQVHQHLHVLHAVPMLGSPCRK